MNTSNPIHHPLRLALFLANLAALSMLPLSASAADAANGQRLYQMHCAGCHGANGLSTMPNTPNLARGERMNQPDPVLVEKLRTGTKSMPPFFGILKNQEFEDVISYVRTLH